MTTPRISILVPCFNQGDTLPATVESVVAQTRDDWELLIVDDGSTDETTRALFADYAPPRATVFRTANRGLAAARNFLAAEASGEYLCALDADDLLHPELLSRTAERLDRDPEVTFVSCWLETFGDESWEWRPERCDLPALLAECTVATPSLVRREAVEAVGGWDEAMPHPGYEDWDLWISLVSSGYRGVILPEILFRYRRRAGSMSSICCRGDVHLELMDYLFTKHEASYRAHLEEVLALRDREIGELLRGNWELESRLARWLEPEVARRKAEVEKLRRKLAAIEAEASDAAELTELRRRRAHWDDERGELERRILALDAEKNRHLEEVTALKASASWRIAEPLRRLAAWIGGLRGGR